MKKYLILLLSLILVCSIFVGCSKQEVLPQNQLEILSTDNEYMTGIKKANNELEKYLTNNFALYNFAQIGEEYAESLIIRDGTYELEFDEDYGFIVLYMDKYNYIFSEDSGFTKIDDMVSEDFSTAIFDSYREIISWILNNEDKFDVYKHIDDNDIVSYTYFTTDVDFIKTKYQEAFGNYEFLELYTKSFEFVFSFKPSGTLVQIDWYGTDDENKNTINVATTFSDDITTAYNSIGTDMHKIWDDAKKYTK